MAGQKKTNKTRLVKKNDAEAGSKPVVFKDNPTELGLPRIVARTWGLISSVSYLSNGGYLLMESDKDNLCVGAGAYMLVMGIVIIFLECACCLCPGKNNCCDKMEKCFPFWARGVIYILSTIPVFSLCFGVKTLISSIIVIMLGLIYIFLTCLVKSKKYERMQAHARHEFRERQKGASTTYSAFTTVSDTVASLKKSSLQQMNQGRPKRPKNVNHNKHVA